MYDLHKLGWKSFQQLCLTITREILGQTVEAFLDSHDGGRDGAFTGTWRNNGQEDLTGSFVIQCKFTGKGGHVLKATDLSDEIEKAKKLVERGLADTYVLMTNAGLTGTEAENVRELFRGAGVKHVRTFGATWITDQIRETRRLRMLVPRVYGLGDLSQILDERAYAQARSILESMREDLAKVVVTKAYQRAVDAIDKHGFVLLIGEPASGKTTIASLLSMAALDKWGSSILKLDEPADVSTHWNPEEPSQFFWLDDAFGVTQYEETRVLQWNHLLPRMQPMLRNGAKVVMTSRDYIYKRARKFLKESAFPLLNESQVVIKVQDLSTDEKEQILYNHVRLGDQPNSFRSKIKSHLPAVASNPQFIPEIARRLGNPFFTKDLIITKSHISQFVERRESLLKEIIQGLDADSRAALGLIYMRNGRLASPVTLQSSEEKALQRLGSTQGGCLAALEALTDSLVLFSRASGEPLWQFRHPTIGDAYASVLAESPEHIDIFIQGSDAEQLIAQVTCGDIGLRNALVVPNALFPQILSKLKEFRKSGPSNKTFLSVFEAKGNLQGFLTYRCSKEFLSMYLQHEPLTLDEVCKPGMLLEYVPEVRLAIRLHEFGLLPEEPRRKFVQTVSDYAVNGEDPGALTDEEIQTIFTEDEFQALVQRLRMQLIPRLASVRSDWEFNYPSDEDPEGYMQPLMDLFDSLGKLFSEDAGISQDIESETGQVSGWIDDVTQGAVDAYSAWREDNLVEELESPPPQLENTLSNRSIFDDIDVE